jgi:heptosyltransferase I
MPHKRWPPLRYAELARRLVAYRNAEVSVVFGPDDRDVADEVVFAAEGAATLAPDLSGPIALGAYLRAADVVVGGDTGPVHWAAALGAPTIAIFGPTDPSRYHPRGRPDRALYRRAFCSPCRHRACPDRECLDLIDVGAVASAVLAALDEGRVEAAV